MADISKIKLGSTTYTIKDTEARRLIGLGVQFAVLETLPTADATSYASYSGKIVLIPSTRTGEEKNIKQEYIITRSGEAGAYTYAWEKIGDTAVDLSNYAKLSHKHTVTVGAHTYTPAGTNAASSVSFAGQTSHKLVKGSVIGVKAQEDSIDEYKPATDGYDIVEVKVAESTEGSETVYTLDLKALTATQKSFARKADAASSFATGAVASDGDGASVITAVGTGTAAAQTFTGTQATLSHSAATTGASFEPA